MSPARQLRNALHQPGIAQAMGAHNPLTAVLAQAAGFEVVWSSGLEVSATQALPDANILTMTESLEAAAAMARAIEIPVLADCDSGFGNVNNVMHMVRSYEARGIAGVCIEDKPFPKLNSFVDGHQELAPIDEFASKISAAAAARRDDDFVLVARTEAFICGAGLEEALKRAYAYGEAGADAVLVHSKQAQPHELYAFLDRYRGGLPVVAVPTTYPDASASDLAAQGVAMAIYANQSLRTAIWAIRRALEEIRDTGSTTRLEDRMASLKDVFELQGVPEMLRQQDQFESIKWTFEEAS